MKQEIKYVRSGMTSS